MPYENSCQLQNIILTWFDGPNRYRLGLLGEECMIAAGKDDDRRREVPPLPDKVGPFSFLLLVSRFGGTIKHL